MPPGFYHLCPEDPPVKTLFIAAIVASSLAAGIARADGDCQAKATAKTMAERLLANLVVEDYRITVL